MRPRFPSASALTCHDTENRGRLLFSLSHDRGQELASEFQTQTFLPFHCVLLSRGLRPARHAATFSLK